jgi:glycine/D-amino acid oxidase-like deaminating enzyme
MEATVDEVGRVAEAEGIDCHYHKGGWISLARGTAQLARLREEVAAARAAGVGDDDLRLLGPDEARSVAGATQVSGGTYSPHCAALHPARLARGLAAAVELAGARIYEQTPVLAIGRGAVRTPAGRVRAEVVVRATESYTVELPGLHRRLAPVYSLMIVTEPLAPEVLGAVGLDRREVFNDGRHVLVYGQRTADGRIAFGGRGAPYHYGSRIAPRFDRHERVHARLAEALVELFPALAAARITHAWGGSVAIPRDWFPSVGYDRAAGVAWAGGYVGDGVATANLAGRTLADLVTGDDTDLVRLPWVGHHSPDWEPEPLRWLGVNGMLAVMRAADRTEAWTGRPSRLAGVAGRLLGG